MALLARLFDFLAGTTIVSDAVDQEFNQLVNLISGVSNNKEMLVTLSDAVLAPVNANQAGAGPIMLFKKNGNVLGRVGNAGHVQALKGATDFTTAMGMLDIKVTATSPAGAVETDLWNRNILANSLDVNGDIIKLTAYFSLASAIANKVLRLYFGTTKVFDSGVVVPTTSPFALFTAIGQRVDADNIRFFTSIVFQDTAILPIHQNGIASVAGLFASDRVLRLTGESAGAGAPNLLQAFIEMGGIR